MDAATLLLILAIAGVNFGWQSASDGSAGYEYIVQVEPELFDALERGDSIPIESNIPPEVAPIRKVRVVVGRGELPRAPLRHTVNFAEQTGWAPDRYPAASGTTSNLERYPAPAQSQSLLDRTGTAITESGSAISDGVQAGMRSAQDQFSRSGGQVLSDSQKAAQQFGQQLQSAGNSVRSATEQTFDATSNQVRQAGNSLGLTGNSSTTTGTTGVSAPPWPQASPTSSGGQQSWPTNPATTRGLMTDTTSSPGMAVTRTATGWTSIGANVAAPPLLNPPLTTAAGSGTGLRIAQSAASGPSLAAPAPSTSREPLHSVLVDPSRQPATTGAGTNDWGNSWTTNTAAPSATIERGQAANNGGLVPVQPRYPNQSNTQQAADRWGDPWAETDPWKQQQGTTPQPPGTSNNAGNLATNNGWPANPASSAPSGTNVTAQQPIIGQAPPPAASTGFGPNPGLQGGIPQSTHVVGTSPAGVHLSANPGSPTEHLPWMPFLLVTLSLIGSLSANFYLVLSYIGARQRYVSLVQKTADTFRRAAGAAAAA